MNCRSIVFWLKDFLQNGIIYSHVKQIKKSLSGIPNTNKEEDDLANLLQYATKNVEFYKNIEPYLQHFPIINKITIKKQEKLFISHEYKKENLFKEMTSGSTGTPLCVYQDPNKRKHASADTIAYSEFAGFKLGTKLYYSRVWTKLNKKSKLQSKIQNIVTIDSDKLSDRDLQDLIDLLEKDKSIKSVLIFASTLTSLYRYMLRNKISTTAKVECFITMSESLPISTKIGIKKLFNCPVVSRYSNCECGILAQQDKDSDYYIINTSSFKIEILDYNSDTPVKNGELGRIIVTDLFNYSMPIIRYDTGDIGAMDTINGIPVLTRVDGRRIDFLYTTSGNLLSPYIVNNNMVQFTEIEQYQFIQNNKNDYLLKINSIGRFNCEEQVIATLKKYLGNDANIIVEYVNDIPLLSSGKRKQVICNYNK